MMWSTHQFQHIPTTQLRNTLEQPFLYRPQCPIWSCQFRWCLRQSRWCRNCHLLIQRLWASKALGRRLHLFPIPHPQSFWRHLLRLHLVWHLQSRLNSRMAMEAFKNPSLCFWIQILRIPLESIYQNSPNTRLQKIPLPHQTCPLDYRPEVLEKRSRVNPRNLSTLLSRSPRWSLTPPFFIPLHIILWSHIITLHPKNSYLSCPCWHRLVAHTIIPKLLRLHSIKTPSHLIHWLLGRCLFILGYRHYSRKQMGFMETPTRLEQKWTKYRVGWDCCHWIRPFVCHSPGLF